MTPLHTFHAIIIAAGLCLGSPASAQNQMELQVRAEAALVSGDPQSAIAITQDILANQPATFAPVFLQALAYFELDQHREAASAASKAFALAQTQHDRRQAAQLAGSAWQQAGAYQRAAFWLRRAAHHAETPEAWLAIAQSYQQLRAENPLSLSFGAWTAPSDNINNGSEDPYFQLEGLPFDFVLPASQRALSGVEYGAEARLSYRLSQSARQRTSVGAYLLGQTYTLSSEAKEIAPELDGDDFAVGVAELSFTHERNFGAGLGPSSVTLSAGRVWYGGEPTWNYRTVSVQQGFVLGDTGRLTVHATDSLQEAIGQDATVEITDLGSRFENVSAGGYGWNLTTGYTYSDGGFENVFDEYRIGGGVALPKPIWGTLWSGDITLGMRDYPTFTTTLDGRRDRFASLSVTATLTEFTYWGFAPQVIVSGRTTTSTAEEFTTDAVGVRLGIVSTF